MTHAHPPRPAPARDLLSLLGAWLPRWTRPPWPTTGTPVRTAGTWAPPCDSSVRVLVVDDNPLNLMVISAMLESRGIVPLLAADGVEAAALACELHFDLILMDLQMPVLGGLAATETIRHFEDRAKLPAVPVVAYSSTDVRPQILAQHGLNGRLPKPCTGPELDACLAHWCPTHRLPSAPAGAPVCVTRR